MGKSWLARIAATMTYLPIATALLYVIGLVYERSFLVTLGLREAQFPISFERAVFAGIPCKKSIVDLIRSNLSDDNVVILGMAKCARDGRNLDRNFYLEDL